MLCQFCQRDVKSPKISEKKLRSVFRLLQHEKLPDICCNCFKDYLPKHRSISSLPMLPTIEDAIEGRSYAAALLCVEEILGFQDECDTKISGLLNKIKAFERQKQNASRLLEKLRALEVVFPELKYEIRRRGADRTISNPKLRSRIFTRDGWKCKSCGTSSELSIDHIHPVAKGGGDEDTNLQTLCNKCNSRKSTKTTI